jgi:hypothetical protein
MYLKLCEIIRCRCWNLSSAISLATRNLLPRHQSATNPLYAIYYLDDDHALGDRTRQPAELRHHVTCGVTVQGPVVYHLTSLGGQKYISKFKGLCVPLNKFRGPEILFESLGAYVTQAYKFTGLQCI